MNNKEFAVAGTCPNSRHRIARTLEKIADDIRVKGEKDKKWFRETPKYWDCWVSNVADLLRSLDMTVENPPDPDSVDFQGERTHDEQA